MRLLMKMAILQIVILMWPIPFTFAENPKNPQFMSQARVGFSQVYNMDYDDAMEAEDVC